MSRSNLQNRKGFVKSVGGIGAITILSRILGLIREMVRAAILGTSFYSDAFTLAFTLPNLFRRLTAEGGMSNAFIPVFSEILDREGKRRAFDFARNFFWALTAVLTLFSLLFIVCAPWLIKSVFAAGFSAEPLQLTVFLTRLMFAYIILISLAAVCQGILNSHSVFWVSSLTPVLLNICIIGFGVFFASRLRNPTYGFAIGVLVGGTVQLLFQLPFLGKQGFRLFVGIDFRDPYIRRVGILVLPTVFGVGIYQINIIVSNLIASTVGEGAISSLNFSNRLLELVLGVFIISITTVMLPRFSSLFLHNELDEIRSNLQDALRLVAFVAFPATVGIFMASEEVVALLFGRGEFDANSMAMTSGALRCHIIGLIFISWNRVVLTCYQAAKHIRRTVQISTVVMTTNLIVALWLSRYVGHLGIALASTISQMVQTLLLAFFLRELSISKTLVLFTGKSIRKSLLISLFLAGSLWFFKQRIIPPDLPILLNVVLLVGCGVLSYAIPAYLLKSRELIEVIELISKRKP
ncbi:MAG: murein biosynthesis integral membrane protein MurJ [Proteobacteria bacterium]|nr:murein biosynthesis integral membrane protein MurJ [Pseudomonadota bacterium]